MARGGYRPNAGRPPKAEEEKLIKLMDRTLPTEQVLVRLAEQVNKGDVQAIKLWLAYRWYLPRQTTDITSNGKPVGVVINAQTTTEAKELNNLTHDLEANAN